MRKGALVLSIIVVLAAMAMRGLSHQPSTHPAGNPSRDTTAVIRLKAVQGLHYDVVRFRVKPGANLRMMLINTDDMDHNLVFTAPGKRKDVLAAALKLGARGPELHYIPPSSDVLWHIAILKPGDSQTIAFKAPLKKGIYPYVCTLPGHGVTMYGAMYVTDEPLPPLQDDPNIPAGNKPRASIHDHGPERLHPYLVSPPYVVRTFMADCGPAAIAVSLPDSLSYCWDAGSCQLRYAWSGPFMRKVDLWQRKGDEVAQIGGKLFFKRQTDYPLHPANSKAVPQMKFMGYTLIEGYPEFHYQLDGLDVYELIKSQPGGTGIDCFFRIPRADRQMEFSVAAPNKAIVHASAGTWKSRTVLRLSPEEASHFTISITKK